MAMTAEQTVKKATRKVIASLNSIGESIYNDGVKKSVMEAAEEAVEIARGKLLKTDPRTTSQQITPQEAASEVQAVYNSVDKSISIVSSLDYSKRNAMYFLEYGAGIASESSLRAFGEPWVYKIRHGDNVHKKITYYEAMLSSQSSLTKYGQYTSGNSAYDKLAKQGAAAYNYKMMYDAYLKGKTDKKPRNSKRYNPNAFETKVFQYKGKMYGLTASSQAIGYMRAAREHLNIFAPKKIANAISIIIAKRTNRPMKDYDPLRVKPTPYDPHDHIKDIY